MWSEAMIQADGLGKTYKTFGNPLSRLGDAMGLPMRPKRTFQALENVSFAVADGESVGILGTNGSGKSTLLQIIAGTSMPTQGTVRTRGSVAGILELGAGFLPDLSGRENAILNAQLLGLSKDEARAKMPWIEEFAGIGQHLDMPVRTYSSGMFVRLAFAVAASVDPDVLIVDEAMAVGDVVFQQKCFAHMRTAMRDATRLFVTHDVASLPAICERSIVLSKGRVVFDGTTKDAVVEYLRQAHESSLRDRSAQVVLDAILSGPREIEIVSASVNDKPVLPGDLVTIRVGLSSSIPSHRHAVVGMNWMDETGRLVFGRNTDDQGMDMVIQPGEKAIEMSFRWPRLRAGRYTCTIGVADRDESTGPYRLQCWAHNILGVDAIISEPIHGMFAVDIESLIS